MKTIIAAIALLAAVSVNAQSDKYEDAMKKNLSMFDSVKTTLDYQNLSSGFERIGDAEKTQWLPYYYAGLALTTAGWADPNLDKDANAEKVKSLCDKAEALTTVDSDKAEILSLRNMAATQQMVVDPQTRWQTYGAEAHTALQKAMELNPNNPRLYYLQGMSLFNTPEQFGGGKDKAKPVFEKAVALYKTEQAKPLYPHWGQQQAEDMLAKCQ
jgi:tetratricopeptide (TPR) repeat protein